MNYHTQLQHRLIFTTEVCYSVHGGFFSYKTVRTFSEKHLVERGLSVEVTKASGNWKWMLPLKIILVSVSTGYCFRNG